MAICATAVNSSSQANITAKMSSAKRCASSSPPAFQLLGEHRNEG